MTPKNFDVVGIGNAIVDVLVQSDDSFLANHGLNKGTMALVSAEQAEQLYAAMGPGVETSGGSAANTLAAVAQLGGGPVSSVGCATTNWGPSLPMICGPPGPFSIPLPPTVVPPPPAA